jgi:Crinkler effector protein N-terminal domain
MCLVAMNQSKNRVRSVTRMFRSKGKVAVQVLRLCCIVKGHNTTFSIEISGNDLVSNLKEKIYAKCSGYPAQHLCDGPPAVKGEE